MTHNIDQCTKEDLIEIHTTFVSRTLSDLYTIRYFIIESFFINISGLFSFSNTGKNKEEVTADANAAATTASSF